MVGADEGMVEMVSASG